MFQCAKELQEVAIHHLGLWKKLNLLWGPTDSRSYALKEGQADSVRLGCKNSQDGESWKLDIPAAGRSIYALPAHLWEQNMLSAVVGKKEAESSAKGTAWALQEHQKEGCSLDADPSAVGNGPVCGPTVWGNFAASQGLWFIVESLQKPPWLSDYWCLLLVHAL